MVGLTVVGVGGDRGLSWMRPWVCVMGWGWLCWWVKAIGCGFMVVGLLGGGHRRGWGGFGCGFVVGSNWGWGSDRGCWGGGFCGSFVAVLWSVLVAVCVVFFFFGGYRLRLWLVVVAVAVAVAVVTSDELEKFRLWRFLEQILERGRSFLVCAVGFFFWFLVVGGWGCGWWWWLWLWLEVMSLKSQAIEILRANIKEREKLLN